MDVSNSILFWNINRNGETPLRIIIEEMEDISPEFMGMVEAEGITNQHLEVFRNKFPNYQIQKLKGGMLIAVRGKIDKVTYEYEPGLYKFNQVNFTINHQKKSILITDVNAVPFNNRGSSLEVIYKFAKENNSSFVMGDFNTPYKSIDFSDFRKNLNSFRDVTNGFTATWPYGIPLLEIDQIWSAKEIIPLLLEKKYYKTSDHALLIARYK